MTASAIGKGVWVVRTGANSMKHSRQSDDIEPYERDLTEPAPTLDRKVGGSWTVTRPATTVCADPRVFSPGGHMANDGRDNSRMVGRSENAIKITEADALILQSFRPDYPLQGSRSKRFEQVGNAVPPQLAAAVLRALIGEEPGRSRQA